MTKPFSFLIKKKGRPKCSEERLFLFVLFFFKLWQTDMTDFYPLMWDLFTMVTISGVPSTKENKFNVSNSNVIITLEPMLNQSLFN